MTLCHGEAVFLRDVDDAEAAVALRVDIHLSGQGGTHGQETGADLRLPDLRGRGHGGELRHGAHIRLHMNHHAVRAQTAAHLIAESPDRHAPRVQLHPRRQLQVRENNIPLLRVMENEAVDTETVGERDAAHDHLRLGCLMLCGVDVHHGLGMRQSGADELLDSLGDLMCGIHMQIGRGQHHHLHIGIVTDLAHAEPLQRVGRHALLHQLADGEGSLPVSLVHQVIDSLHAQVTADAEDEESHDERGEDIRPHQQPVEPAALHGHARRRCAADTQQHGHTAPNIRGKVSSIRLQRRALRLPRHALEHAGPVDIHHQRSDNHEESPDGHLHMQGSGVIARQALDGLLDHPTGRDEQQQRLTQGHQVLHLTVAVGMLVIRRAGGHLHRVQRATGGQKIQRAVQGLRQNTQGACQDAYNQLRNREKGTPHHR